LIRPAPPAAPRRAAQRRADRPLHSDPPQFLSAQLPARLENHVERLRALLPDCGAPALSELLSASAASKESVLEVSRDWGLLDRASLKGLQHFESHLAGFRERVEAEMARLMAGAQELSQRPGWWDAPRDVGALNTALDLTHWYGGGEAARG
jgi:hypothetical protein